MFQREFLILLIILFAQVACVKGPTADTVDGNGGKLYGDIGSEKPYCSTVSSPAPATTITATAQYKYRQVSRVSGLQGPATANIRFAEVQVLNSSGTTVQCGETDSSGGISISIPRVAGTYTLKVLSRANNANVRASILNNPTSMTPYSISTSFTIASSDVAKAVTLPIADYKNTLEGGAFNVLDQIYLANDFIRNNSTCPTVGGVCAAEVGSIQKIQVFWTPGLSPGAYFGSPTESVSFFSDSDDPALGMASGLYLMGGVNGSVCEDTDHFDNSIIIHEYGHFLEKVKAHSDSPGGSHGGNAQIDPRLAWSEGWANYLQGAVRGDKYYIDTTGNSDCASGTAVSVLLDMENKTQDIPSATGEGTFREVSVSRTLWDTMESNAGGDGFGANAGFGAIWKIFSDPTIGFRSSSVHFRSIAYFNELMRSFINTNAPGLLVNYDALLANEKQLADRTQYAYPLTAQVAACTFDLQGVPGSNNLTTGNDFYAYYYDGNVSNASITLKYAATPGGTPSDLDLYVWKEAYAFSDSTTLVGNSARFYPESGGTGVEVVSLSGQPAGYYLIQVVADPDSVATTARYYLETSGGTKRLCP